jgi:hypothetical protein
LTRYQFLQHKCDHPSLDERVARTRETRQSFQHDIIVPRFGRREVLAAPMLPFSLQVGWQFDPLVVLQHPVSLDGAA